MKFTFNMEVYGALNTTLDWQYDQREAGDVMITIYPTSESDSGEIAMFSFDQMFQDLINLSVVPFDGFCFPTQDDKDEVVDELNRIHDNFEAAFQRAMERVKNGAIREKKD